MKNKKLRESFYHAFQGIVYAVKSQRNMKIHCILAIIAILLGQVLNLTNIERLILYFTIFLVVICEMINTAVETTIDLITKEYHELARIAKNVAAGAVLLAALNSIVVAYFLFFKRLLKFLYP